MQNVTEITNDYQLANSTMVIHVAAKSDIGCQREKNEDSYFVDPENGLYIVCDGMGGHLAGEVASQKAIEFTVDFINKAKSQRILPGKRDIDFRNVWTKLLVEAIESCCDQLCVFADSHPEFSGMATTITVVQIIEDVAFVGYLGDSRLYLKQGSVAKQLTSDHTLFAEFTKSNPSWINSNNAPVAMARFKHLLTRCVGRERDFDVDAFSFQLVNEDVLLMCTDGLSNYLLDEESIVRFLSETDSGLIVDALVDFANAQGGRDNITAIVIRITGLDESETKEPNQRILMDPGVTN